MSGATGFSRIQLVILGGDDGDGVDDGGQEEQRLHEDADEPLEVAEERQLMEATVEGGAVGGEELGEGEEGNARHP